MNEGKKRVLRAVAMVCIAACVTVSGLYLKKWTRSYERNPVRPEEFPAMLVPPDGAESVDYWVLSKEERTHDTYGLSFFVRDSYPGQETQDFIKEVLEGAGCRKLEFDFICECVRPEWAFCNGPGEPYYRLAEDWLNASEETIYVIFEYVTPPGKDHIDTDILCVQLMYATRNTRDQQWLLSYKREHPEEFRTGSRAQAESEE